MSGSTHICTKWTSSPCRRVHLRVPDAGARAHALGQAGVDDAAVAHRVLVLELARQHPGDDLHVLVGMGAEAGAGPHDVVVVDEQQPVADVRGVVVAGEAERVVGVEPAAAWCGSGRPPGGRRSGNIGGRFTRRSFCRQTASKYSVGPGYLATRCLPLSRTPVSPSSSRACASPTGRSGPSTASTSPSPPAPSSACSGPTGRARPRPCASSPPCCRRTAGGPWSPGSTWSRSRRRCGR